MLARILPPIAFVLSLLLVAFAAGVAVTEFKLPPYRSMHYGAKTLRWTWNSLSAPPFVGTFIGVIPGLPAGDAPGARMEPTPDSIAEPGTLMMTGGLNQYLEICPEDGCLAVEMARDGTVLRGIPFRPDEIFAADTVGSDFHREGVPPDPRQVFRPVGLQVMENGDLVISFLATGPMFPYAAGVARIDPEGHPVWYRFDYSHHWVTYDDGLIYVPDLTVEEGNLDFPVGPNGRILSEYCETGRPMIDGVQILNADGELVKRINLMKALRESPWISVLAESFDGCDPLHANFVDVLDNTAPGGDLMPGNLLISLRNVSALVVLDPGTEEITRIIRGSFMHQHSSKHLEGSRVLLFDNWGGSGAGHGSRLLEVDLNGGERQIFPPADAPDPRMFSFREGNLDISRDRQRALVSFTDAAGVEVDLDTGTRLLTFNSLHDLSSVEGATDAQRKSATRAKLFGMSYLD